MYDFRKRSSTEYAIPSVARRIYQRLDIKKVSVSSFLFVKKAELNYFGVNGVAWKQLNGSDRRQLTLYNNCVTDEFQMGYGAPQGSYWALFFLYHLLRKQCTFPSRVTLLFMLMK